MNTHTKVGICILLCGISITDSARAEEVAPPTRNPNTDSRDRAAAVALNYCRAAFHRIKTSGTKPVLVEEEEEILNNLNLNGIADQEVVTLYTKVLDEIGGEAIAEQERQHLKNQFRRSLGRQIMSNAFVMSTQVTSLQFGQAVQTGASSWWDYRNLSYARDTAMWNVDKNRMTQVITSSSQFLDTFWKMTQKKNIPDRWLVRSADLDNLDVALREKDPETRIRLLQRLEKFMECYPPYWYHVARTHQSMGNWSQACETYEHLANYGAGHFRRDEMLAAGMANLAAIQDFQGNPEAVHTAREALDYADTAWQANLVCSRILAKHGRYQLAEEAALRNIDSNLERSQSLVALMSIYEDAGDRKKLAQWLGDEKVLNQVPAPAVLRACRFLGTEEVPTVVNRHLLKTLFGYADLNFGMDDVVFVTDPLWEIDKAQVSLAVNGRPVNSPQMKREDDRMSLRFANAGQLGGFFDSTPRPVKVALTLKYPYMQPMTLELSQMSSTSIASIWKQSGGKEPSEMSRRGGAFLVSDVNFGGQRLSLLQIGPPSQQRTRYVKTPRRSKPVRVVEEGAFQPAQNPFRAVSQYEVNLEEDDQETIDAESEEIEVLPVIDIEGVVPVEDSEPVGEQSE